MAGSEWKWWKHQKGNETNRNGDRRDENIFPSHLVLYITFRCYVFFGGALRALCSITGNTTAHPATAKQYPGYISSRQHLTDIKKLPGTARRRECRAGGPGSVKMCAADCYRDETLCKKQQRGGKQQTRNGIRQVLHSGKNKPLQFWMDIKFCCFVFFAYY